jgi:hypothetical protein
MPALVGERLERRDGRSYRIRVYREATRADLLANGDGFKRRSSGAVLVVRRAA